MTKKKRPEDRRKPGRPTNGPYEVLHVRIPPTLKGRLEGEAQEREETMTDVIVRLLRRRYPNA